MKPNINFYTTTKWVLIYVIAAAAIAWISSCELIPAIAPDDWVYHPPKPDTVQADTIPVDTIPIDTVDPPDSITVDTCIDPIEIVDPAFVTLYVEFDILETDILWQGGQVESNNLADVIEAVTPNPYTIYNIGKSWAVIIDSTNDNQSLYLKVFAKSNGAKVYMGSIMQGFIFAGALTAPEYLAAAIKYQSVDRFNYRNCPYSEADLIAISEVILGWCKLGRTWSDFRWWNGGTVPDSIPLAFNDAGWNTVLHGPEADCVVDLRGQGKVNIEAMRSRIGTCQLIVDDCD